ncbi:hypothetical protein BJ508DRAFT_331111 [Ascobolus immersus RN42]|uniref:Uncharacterized protein n=1 Tax=Ascobolus immersus RN42 TaxID=1160509 RepID=A0A3N4HRU5_ASCIM|nr:hypothetical protein BJ508DRAFT_331111 [Ascobolus immersus RN42]
MDPPHALQEYPSPPHQYTFPANSNSRLEPSSTTPSYAAQTTTSQSTTASFFRRLPNYGIGIFKLLWYGIRFGAMILAEMFIIITETPSHLVFLALELAFLNYTTVYTIKSLMFFFPLVPSITIRINQLIIKPILNPSRNIDPELSVSDWLRIPADRKGSLKVTAAFMTACASAFVSFQEMGYFPPKEPSISYMGAFGTWDWLVTETGHAFLVFWWYLSMVIWFALFHAAFSKQGKEKDSDSDSDSDSGSENDQDPTPQPPENDIQVWPSRLGRILFRVWIVIECAVYIWRYTTWVMKYKGGDGCNASLWDYWKGKCWGELELEKQ